MSSYNRKSFDIAGYMFQADIVCPDCVVGAYNGNSNDYDAETMLGILAGNLGIERYDESSFDSDEFPKVVFVDNITEGDVCGECGEEL
jgi:hypothetical protein